MKRTLTWVGVLTLATLAHAADWYVDGSTPFSPTTHNVQGTVGGAATTGQNTLTLAVKVGSEVDDVYNNYGIVILTDPSTEGEGQYRRITDYNATTNVVTVNSNWSANLSASSTYRITVGNDSTGTGADTAPYAHIKKAIDQASLSAGPHTIYVRPGIYEEVDSSAVDRLICAKASNGPYTVSRWGSAGSVLVKTGGEAADAVLRVGSTQNWTFNDITFQAVKAYTDGVLFFDGTRTTNTFTFNNCGFDGSGFAMGTYGVVHAVGGAACAANVEFNNCVFYLDNATTGALYAVMEDGGTVTWNTCTLFLDHTARKSLMHKNTNQFGTVTIKNCVFDNTNGSAQWSSLIQLMFCSGSGKLFTLIDLDSNTNIDRIVDYDDSSLYTEAKRWVIRNNVSTDIYGDFCYIQRNIKTLDIYNNTITLEGPAIETQTIRLGTSTTPNPGPLGVVRVTNNTIYDSSSGHDSTRGIALDYGVDGAEVVGNKIRVPKGAGIETRGSYNSIRHNMIRAPFAYRLSGAATRNLIANNTGVAIYDGVNNSGAVSWRSESSNLPTRNAVRQNILVATANTYCLREWTTGEHYGTVVDGNCYWFSGTGAHLCGLNSDPDDTLADMRAKWANSAYGTWNTGEDPPIGNDQFSVLSDPKLIDPASGNFSLSADSPMFATGYPQYLSVGAWVPNPRQRYGMVGPTGTFGPE